MADEEGTRTMTPRILAFAGSLRRESFNKTLVPIAAKGARDAGAEVTLIDLKDFPLPLFDQDLEAEQGMPEDGKKLKQLFIDHDGLPRCRVSGLEPGCPVTDQNLITALPTISPVLRRSIYSLI